MDKDERKRGALEDRADAYAEWVAELRLRDGPLDLSEFDADPVVKLGHALRRLADGIARREEQLNKLFEVVHKVERGFLVEDVLNGIFESFAGIIPYDRMGCAFLADGGTRLSSFWARSNLGPQEISNGYSQPMSGSSLEELFRTGEPRILNDLRSYLDARPESDSTRRIVAEGGQSSLTCPLFVDGRPLGVLFFTSREKNAYAKIHQTAFRQIAKDVATVIQKSRLFQDLLDSNQFLVRQAAQLKEVANRDALTGVLNRKAIMAALERKLQAAAVGGGAVGVIMVDVDRFKKINDAHGHVAGDAVLREFARRLTATLRQTDHLGRYGGEEFAIVICDTNWKQLKQIAERFRSTIAGTPFIVGDESRTLTASFGIALAPGGLESAEAVVAAADQALYAAKAGGRNRCVLA
jgi:diguanylate cyclase (GGDEF)-like protein